MYKISQSMFLTQKKEGMASTGVTNAAIGSLGGAQPTIDRINLLHTS